MKPGDALTGVAAALAAARFATEATVRDRGGAVVLTLSVGEEHFQVALTRDNADDLGMALLKMGADGPVFGGPARLARRIPAPAPAYRHRAWCQGGCGNTCLRTVVRDLPENPGLCEHGSVAGCCSRCRDS